MWRGCRFAGASLAAFLLPSALGEGVTRFRFVALPLVVLALSLRRWRPLGLSVTVVLLAGVWSMAPLVSAVANGTDDASAQPAYWRPAVDYLHLHLTPSYRVEAVDTERHWAAAYLPEAGIPLARGWFRQNDFPLNAILYGDLSAARYRRWLRDLAVRYVVLPDATLDYSAQAEAALLRSGRSGLRKVFSARHVTIFEVPRARRLVEGTGAAEVVSLTPDGMTLRAQPVRYRIAIRASPHWQASSGCLSDGHDGLLRLVVDRGGAIVLSFRVGWTGVMRALVGGSPECASGGPPR